MNNRNKVYRLLAGMALLILGGCASAEINQTRATAGPLPRPDMIVVYNFDVTADEVNLDQGVMAKAKRDKSKVAVSEEEKQVGHLVADKLAASLVDELRKAGIAATRASDKVMATRTTGFLTGQFIKVDQGNQTQRTWIGFGLGGTELRTQIQLYQGGELIAEARTATKSSLKPGMLVSAGLAGGAGTVAPLVVGATGVVVTEKFKGTVEADAARTAAEVAKQVKKAYQERGWLP